MTDKVALTLLGILYVVMLVGYLWFRLQWSRGKVKIKFTGEDDDHNN